MDVKQLLADEDRLLKEMQKILMQNKLGINEEEMFQIVQLRDQVIEIKKQIASNPHFHPETLNCRYLH